MTRRWIEGRIARATGLAAGVCAGLLWAGAAPAIAQQVPRVRTPDARFENLKGYPFAPHYLEVNGLRMHYVDEGQPTRGTFLLLHGEPSWSYLYRNIIPVLTRAGYRTVAPDMIGFGKSDKVTDESWYTIEAHVRQLRGFIEALDLRNVTLVVQDWGGPYGLINATDMPERFVRLFILNTWLHHEGYEYTQALRDWNARSQGVDFSRLSGQAWAARSPDDVETLSAAYRAPFHSPESQAGARRWPWMLPFKNPTEGGAERQARAYAALATWKTPVHVIFGNQDQVFNETWGRQFAAHIPGATFDAVPGAGHMVQEVGAPLAELFLQRIAGR